MSTSRNALRSCGQLPALLMGSQFTLRTDNRSLQWRNKSRDAATISIRRHHGMENELPDLVARDPDADTRSYDEEGQGRRFLSSRLAPPAVTTTEPSASASPAQPVAALYDAVPRPAHRPDPISGNVVPLAPEEGCPADGPTPYFTTLTRGTTMTFQIHLPRGNRLSRRSCQTSRSPSCPCAEASTATARGRPLLRTR